MGKVQFEDNSMFITDEIESAALKFLEEASGELKSQVKRRTRVDIGQLEGSWEYVVDADKMIGIVGSPEENAIWEEFGTGEYALKGNGRKKKWKYKHHKYGWLTTTGKAPSRAFEKAKNASKKPIKSIAEKIFGDIGK
nr:MAG TPA: putative tail component [Caudoviricetes sp.]